MVHQELLKANKKAFNDYISHRDADFKDSKNKEKLNTKLMEIIQF